MRLVLKASLICLAAIGTLSLIACGKPEPATNVSASPKNVTTMEDGHDHSHDHHSEDAQVIVSGVYHLEFLTEPKDNGVNLDFHLENEDSHEVISGAKVTATVQLPSGDQKTLDLPYEADSEHYIAFLPAPAKGQYTVTILTEINDEQINGQFSFDL